VWRLCHPLMLFLRQGRFNRRSEGPVF
jgi:hypothetical protein